MSNDIDHELTDLPVCPHCGYAERDWSDWFTGWEDTATVVCASCEKEYSCHAEFSVTFTTRKSK